jgi:zinc and cadmium transporter
MTVAAWLLTLYCALALLASLTGGVLPMMVRLTHTRLQTAISFVSGLMLGMALLHLIPHAVFQIRDVDRVMMWALAGFLVMFFLQRFFHFHHHDMPEDDPEDCCRGHSEPHNHDHSHTLADKSARQLSWAGTALGLSLHSLLDGLALAAAVLAEARNHAGLAGLGTALVVILHKPFDSMAVATLMTAGGSSAFSRHSINSLFALATPVGAALFCLGMNQLTDSHPALLGSALAFCAGNFLCIACSDLLPELQFHSHDRFKLSVALLAGLAVSLLIGRFESTGHGGHEHDPAPAASFPARQGGATTQHPADDAH